MAPPDLTGGLPADAEKRLDEYRQRERSFRSAKRDALRALVLAAIVAALLVAILIVTATDLARAAERALAPPAED